MPEGLVTKNLIHLPRTFLDYLRQAEDTGMGYQVVAIRLKDGRWFNQVIISEGRIVEVQGYRDIPFAPEHVDSIVVNHKRWNFRNWSDARK